MQEDLKKLSELLQVFYSIGGTKGIDSIFTRISKYKIDTLSELVNELEDEASFISDLIG